MYRLARRALVAMAMIVSVAVLLLPVVVPGLVENLVNIRLRDLGLKPDIQMQLGYCWRNGPGVEGRMRLSLVDSPWCVRAVFGASCCEWSASVWMDETAFDESDETLRMLLGQLTPPSVSNLQFSGSIALSASAERTFRKPVPVWQAKLPIRNFSASATIDDKPFSISGLTVVPNVSGIADHVDIAPVRLRATTALANAATLTNVFVSARVSTQEVFITQASAGFCGGKVNVYALFLDPKNLNAAFTVYCDDIDAGQMLNSFRGFRGTATGRLHGKSRLFVRKGGASIRLSDAFLYSTPGEIGKLRMENPDLVSDNLAMAGIDARARDNLDNALRDLDYSVLKLDLKRQEGNELLLTTRVCGTTTRGSVTVPVDITVNFHGELEQIINTGLRLSSKMKGSAK